MNVVTEKELQTTVSVAFEAAGQRVFHIGDSRKEVMDGERYELVGDTQAAGYPDLTIAGGGKILWAELKSQQGKLEPLQVEWLDELPAHQAYVWRPEDLERALEVAISGHRAAGPTCWTCHREEILKRIGVRRRKRGTTPEMVTVQTSGDLLVSSVAVGGESYLSTAVCGRTTVIRPLNSEQLPEMGQDRSWRRNR